MHLKSPAHSRTAASHTQRLHASSHMLHCLPQDRARAVLIGCEPGWNQIHHRRKVRIIHASPLLHTHPAHGVCALRSPPPHICRMHRLTQCPGAGDDRNRASLKVSKPDRHHVQGMAMVRLPAHFCVLAAMHCIARARAAIAFAAHICVHAISCPSFCLPQDRIRVFFGVCRPDWHHFTQREILRIVYVKVFILRLCVSIVIVSPAQMSCCW